MSENYSGAGVQQADNRGEQKDKRQRFDQSKQDNRRYNNRNHNNQRRRNNGQRQGGYEGKGRDNADAQADNKGQGQGSNRSFDRDRQGKQNKNPKFNREQGQGGEKKNQQFAGERKPKNKRPREIDPEVAKTVKKVETIEDIRSDNARITKEIYLEIASLKNINLN